MVKSGVNWQNPSVGALMHFGGNNVLQVVYLHQWWRIISATFVHVGLLHLAGNMWCLWNLGLLGEPLLGFFGVISVYLLTGAAGNLLSTIWNLFARDLIQVGAGASGAVFGIAGILIVLLSNRKLAEPRMGRPGIPWGELVALRKSVIQFAVLNLFIGFATILGGPIRVDNTAHFGGFVCGLAMGVPLLPRMTSGREKYLRRQKIVFAAFALLLALFARWISVLVFGPKR
ncbi:MAG: rhomboid family intramembrane serine protease [Acidobacteria bacterium]|nr:rhomboid family intramembrane serine protease [Acidobacteriota bacterium]